MVTRYDAEGGAGRGPSKAARSLQHGPSCKLVAMLLIIIPPVIFSLSRYIAVLSTATFLTSVEMQQQRSHAISNQLIKLIILIIKIRSQLILSPFKKKVTTIILHNLCLSQDYNNMLFI